MNKAFRWTLLVIFYSFSLTSIAKYQPLPKDIAAKLRRQKIEVKKIERSIKFLEKKLGVENRKYLAVINARKFLDQKISSIRSNFSKQDIRLKKEYSEIQKIVSLNVVQNLSINTSASDLLVKKVLRNSLYKKKEKIEKLLATNNSLQVKFQKLQKRYLEYESMEKSISFLLKDLEVKKIKLARNYIDKIKEKENYLNRAKKKRKIIFSSKNKSIFTTPLVKFKSLDFNKKGITYKFVGKNEVLNPKFGKVVYSGNLSTYGNVVMVDHGDDTRSIILGEFTPSAVKGRKVKRGEVIGHTLDRILKSKIAGKIYFEVRKKNKAQNTILLMDRKFLKKNNLINLKS